MKAAVFYGKEDLRVEERKMPAVTGNQVLIKIRACGICGTDMHIFDGDEGAAPTPAGTVLGHEFSGEVVAVGPEVVGIAPGQRVCVDPNQLCGSCGFCRDGRGHFCTDMIGIGTTVDGGFGEYCVVPQSQVYPFPDTVSFTQAAMTEPVACCLHGIEMCNIRSGDTVAVIGGGMIGLLMIQLARLQGAGTVILSEPVEAKREHGKKLGADIVIDPMAEDLETALQARGITQINTVIECVGNPRTIEQAIAIAGKKATVMLFGLTKPDATVTVKPFALFKKELIVTASFINPYTQQRALNLITSGRLDVSSMIYKTISLEELPGVLADKGIRNAGKYIVTFP